MKTTPIPKIRLLWPSVLLALAFSPASTISLAAPMGLGAGNLSPSESGLELAEISFSDSKSLETTLSILNEIKKLEALPIEMSAEGLEEHLSETIVDDESLDELYAQNSTVKRSKRQGQKTRQVKRTSGRSSSVRPPTGSAARAAAPRTQISAVQKEQDRGRQAVRRNDYFEASKIFFGLLDKEKTPARLLQIRFILGRTLQELKMHQVAAFPYYEIIRSEGRTNPKNRYVRQALERLTVAGDFLESDILLNYAVKQINEEDFPAANRDMLYFRRGEVRYRDKNYIEAARELNRVRSNSSFYNRARYQLALSLVEANQLERAEQVFAALAETSSDAGVTNKSRVNALMGRARTLYQRKLFADSIDAYREIPRDTEQWHDALFESTWALLQDGRFRSALSNFHSLHSPYYDDFYQPESLLLRSIVYHYICRYDEMETTLSLFERVYGPVQRDLKNTLLSTSPSSSISLYREIRRIYDSFDSIKKTSQKNRKAQFQIQIPFLVARHVLREGDVRRAISYIRNLEAELQRIQNSPPTWRDSRVGRYARRVVERRMSTSQVATGRLIRRHLERIQQDLAGHFEQSGLVRLDMLSGKKEAVKKEIAGKGLLRDQVDEDQDRSFFIQNGYDYWPFKGEFWLDEIGNYHYLGVKACE